MICCSEEGVVWGVKGGQRGRLGGVRGSKWTSRDQGGQRGHQGGPRGSKGMSGGSPEGVERDDL